jgi:branched-chain amino acid transport system permease protein
MRTVWTMGFVAAAALSFAFPDFIVFRFTQAAIWALSLLGLVLLCGVSGQFSFAQAALFGMGAYSAALVVNHTALPVYVALLVAPLVGYAAGYGLGRLAGRHDIWTQALIGYALAIAFPQLLRWAPIAPWTGGVSGLYLDLPDAPFKGLSADRWLFLLSLSLLGAVMWLASNIIASRSGRALVAARDHDLSAAAQGIDVVGIRAIAAGLAGGCLALSGCLSAMQYGYVGPTAYNFALSVQMLFGLVVGGMNSIAGALIGGVMLEFLPGLIAGFGKGLSALLYAVLMIAAIVAMPNGIAGLLTRLSSSPVKRGRAGRGKASVELPADRRS